MLVRHGLSDIGSDLRRATSTCIATVRREMFEASERRGKTELHRDSSNRSWLSRGCFLWRDKRRCRRAASLGSDGKVKEGAAVGRLSSGSPGRAEYSWSNLASEYPIIVLDGKLPQTCNLIALDSCYKRFCSNSITDNTVEKLAPFSTLYGDENYQSRDLEKASQQIAKPFYGAKGATNYSDT
ncbi:hypothetical protein Dimus_007940 [Dionaea muscipula]